MTATSAIAVPFPEASPPGYEWFEDEPVFDPGRHLALEEPDEVVMLKDLGYSDDDLVGKATPVAASSPFRILSDEGVTQMFATARRLRSFVKPAGDRIERTVRGGCYRSRWLRDLCLSPDLTAHLAAIYQTPVAPHAMPLHLGHLNYEPSTINTAVDKWHHDTLPLDIVMMVTDPNNVAGGEFEYFQGTKDEVAALAKLGQSIPRQRVVGPTFGGAGFGIALHGDMVVHRAAPVRKKQERITMVNGYVALNPMLNDQSRCRDLIAVDDPSILWTEWAKFVAWRSHGRLAALLEELPFTDDVEAVVGKLQHAIADVQQAVSEMRDGEVAISHYE